MQANLKLKKQQPFYPLEIFWVKSAIILSITLDFKGDIIASILCKEVTRKKQESNKKGKIFFSEGFTLSEALTPQRIESIR